jgi:hypothetical protein
MLSLSVASALPAALVPTTANSDQHPDAELIALGREFDIAGAEADRVSAARDDLEDRAWNVAGGLSDRIDDARISVGLPQIKALGAKTHAHANELGKRILAIRATTLEGLMVKARCALWCHGGIDDEIDGEFNDQQVFLSLVSDLLAVQAESSTVAVA